MARRKLLPHSVPQPAAARPGIPGFELTYSDRLRSGLPRSHEERPTIKALDTRIEWPAKFQQAMVTLCQEREMPASLPTRVKTWVLSTEGILLIWPCPDDEPRSIKVWRLEHRVLVQIPESFEAMQVELPLGVVIQVPVSRHFSAEYGLCLALHFDQAEFLFEESRSSALAVQSE